MGVRYYNGITGAFISIDPIPGANSTAYAYPTDPINSEDVDGEKPRKKRRYNGNGNRSWSSKDRAQDVRWGAKRGSAGGSTAGKAFPRKLVRKLKRNAGRCAYCGTHLRAKRGHIDHIVPRKRGGNALARNAQRACERCNLSKGANIAPRGGGISVGRGGLGGAKIVPLHAATKRTL